MFGPVVARCAFLLGIGISCSAYAHESPHATGLGMAAASGAPVAVLTNRGLITRTEDGWSLRCNESYGVNTTEAVTLLGRDVVSGWMLATPSSVFSSRDEGCAWNEHSPAKGEPLSAALTTASGWYVAQGFGHAAPALHFRSSEGGAWSTLWTSEDDAWVSSLAQAPTNPARLYATFERPDWATRQIEVLWGSSSDGGRSWTRRVTSDAWRLVGVHPEQPDVVFVQRELAAQKNVLLRSADGGESFAEVARGPSSFGPLSRGEDGQLWLAGGAQGGLLASADDGESFLRIYPELASVRCLVWHGRDLYACAYVLEQGEGVYRLGDDSQWSRVLSFEEVRSPTACSAELVCAAAWLDWESEVLVAEGSSVVHDESDPDAAHDHGADDGHEADGSAHASGMSTVGACSIHAWAPARAPSVLWFALLLGAGRHASRSCSARAATHRNEAAQLRRGARLLRLSERKDVT